MRLGQLLTDIETALQAEEDALQVDARDIEIAPGRFDAAEVERSSFRPPAIRIAFIGSRTDKTEASGRGRYQAQLAVFVVTEGVGRSVFGLDVAERVAAIVEAERLGMGFGFGLPTEIQIDSLYTSRTDDTGIVIHSIAWRQAFRLVEEAPLGGPDLDVTAAPPEITGLEINGEEIDVTGGA